MPIFFHSAPNSHTFNDTYNLQKSAMESAVIQMNSYFSQQKQAESLCHQAQFSRPFSLHDPRQVLGGRYYSWMDTTQLSPRDYPTDTFFPFKAFRQDVDQMQI